MASIALNFYQVDRNYPQQKQEIMTQIQNSRSQHRNMAAEDLIWSIEYLTVLPMMSLGTMLNNANQNRPTPPPVHHFYLKAQYRNLSKSVKLNNTPIEFTNQERDRQQTKENLQQRLNNSLTEANANPQRMWLRVRASNGRGRVMAIHAFPILAGVRDAQGSVIVVTDNYENGKSVFKLKGTDAIWMEKDQADRLVELFENNPSETRQRVGRRFYTTLSPNDIKPLTDFSVYREEMIELLEENGIRMVAIGAPEAFDNIDEEPDVVEWDDEEDEE